MRPRLSLFLIFASLLWFSLAFATPYNEDALLQGVRLFGCQEILTGNKAFRWAYDGPAIRKFSPYEPDFAEVLAQRGVADVSNYFVNFIANRKAKGETAHVVDLFGSGYFLPPWTADSMTGVRLMHRPLTDYEVFQGYTMKPHQVTGDIFQEATWIDLQRSLRATERHYYELSRCNLAATSLITRIPSI